MKKFCYGLAAFLFFLLLTAPGMFAGGDIQLKNANGKVLLSFEKGAKVRTGSQTYQYKKWGRNRLKLVATDTNQGVFLKRFSVKLRIRDLEGVMLHKVLKTGVMLKVKRPTGENLFIVKMFPDKAVVSENNGPKLFTIVPDQDKILFKDTAGQVQYILEGETRPSSSAFLCIPQLSWPERIACYLLYRDIFY